MGDWRRPVAHEELAVLSECVSLRRAHFSSLFRLLNLFLLGQHAIPMIQCSNDPIPRSIATQKVKGCREALLDIPRPDGGKLGRRVMLICKLERLGDDIDIVGCDFAQHLFGDDRRLEWEWVDIINIRSDGTSWRGL